MEPRVCPKCGAENPFDSAACSECKTVFASEREVGLLSGPASIPDAPPPTPEEVPPVYDNVPPAAPPPPPQPSAATYPYGAPAAAPGSYGSYVPPRPPSPASPQPTFVRHPHANEGVNWRMVAFVALVLSCTTFAAWWFVFRTPTPADTVNRLISACRSGDYEAAKSCFTRSSLLLLGVSETAPTFAGAYVRTKGDLPIKVVGTSYEGREQEVAVVQCEPLDLPPNIQIRFDLILLQEEGNWKIDIARTLHRARTIGQTTSSSSG